MLPQDAHPSGNIQGGVIMRLIDGMKEKLLKIDEVKRQRAKSITEFGIGS